MLDHFPLSLLLLLIFCELDDSKSTFSALSHSQSVHAIDTCSTVQDNWPLPFSDLDPLDTGYIILYIPYYPSCYELSVAIYSQREVRRIE